MCGNDADRLSECWFVGRVSKIPSLVVVGVGWGGRNLRNVPHLTPLSLGT